MSFILDALRKSETERQRQSGPGLVEAGYRPPAGRRGVWLPVLVVVLLANMALMFSLWQRGADPATPAAATPAPPVAPAESAPVVVGRPLPADDGAADGTDTEYAAIADLPAEEAEPFTETLEPPADAAAAPAAASPPSQVITEGLPTAEQLIATGVISGKAMHLDIHVYSSQPAERFVFINMRKYTEGSQLPDGPRLEEITPEGAIFSHNSQRFVLTRD